jgi:hypothetical protein
MARRYRPGDVKWAAYPDGVARVVVVERGCRGYVFKDGKKPENPYVVSEDGADNYVLGEAELCDNPIEASKQVAQMRSNLGLAEMDDGDEDEDDFEDDEEDGEDEDELEEDEEDEDDLDED